MKRGFKIQYSFFFLLFIFLVNPILSSSSYNVSKDTTFTYEVIESRMRAYFDENDLIADGLRIAGNKVSENEQFEVTINKIYTNSLDFNYRFNGQNESKLLLSSQFKDELTYRLFLPYAEASVLVDYLYMFNDSYINTGLIKELTIFVEPEQSTWDKLTNLKIDFLERYNPYYGNGILAGYEYEIKEKNNKLQFECFLEVLMIDVENYNFSYSLGYKFAYSTVTGHLLGSKLTYCCSGEINNSYVSISSTQQVELEGYNLEDFQIGDFVTGNLIGFTVPMIITILICCKLIRIPRRTKMKLKH